jgi:hypothetical protein
MSDAPEKRPSRRVAYFVVLLIVSTLLALLALMVPLLAPLYTPTLQIGQVAQQDVQAPLATTYQSQVLTEQQQDAATRAVTPIFTSPDPSVARQQMESLRAALSFIATVRADSLATNKQMLADLAALENTQIGQDTAQAILSMSEARWQAIQQEAILVLEQVMRGAIREDRIEEVRRSVPTLVSLSLTEDQADIVVTLVSAFITPNSTYSESLTEAARQKARELVVPVNRSYKAGETIVQRGQVITAADLEALEVMGLVQARFNWKDVIGAAAVTILSILMIALYLRRRATVLQDARGLTVFALLFLVFLLGGRLLIHNEPFISYLLPIAAYSMTVAVLFRIDLALISTLPLVILVSYGTTNAAELHLYYLFSSYFGVLTLGSARRLTSFFRAGLAVAGCSAIIAVAWRPPLSISGWAPIYPLLGAALLNGIASVSLTVILQFFLAQFLGMTTALQLMEVSRPDHPLLQLVLRNASGTYQHSLQVANLAEQAAERIRADALLTRVGALYHDVGKVLNPLFYIENQLPGSPNPHDKLDPVTSAGIIIQHVTNGVELARKYRIPKRVRDFIAEHHGTMIARYQYAKALEAAGGDESQVDIEQFRYPGPRPRSRETAILMLADGSEARVRAERPKDEDAMHQVIKTVIENRISMGQLDGTELTLEELEQITDSFTSTLRGMYHPRIEYPKIEKSAFSQVDTVPVPRAPALPSNEPSTASPVDSPTPSPEQP